MYIFGHLHGHTQQRRIYDYFSNHWREWFPCLPSYQACNRRFNALSVAFELLITEFAQMSAWQIQSTDDRLVDSLPIMLAKGKRANRARIAPDLADVGFCATKGEYYRGVKLHLIAARRLEQLPVAEKMHFSPASQHDLAALRELDPQLPENCALFADRAYSDAELRERFANRGSFLLAALQTASRRNARRRSDLLQSLDFRRAPAVRKFVWLADCENRFAERFGRSFKSRIESALLRKTSGSVFPAHFLTLDSHNLVEAKRLKWP